MRRASWWKTLLLRTALAVLGLCAAAPGAQAASVPDWLPRYDLDMHLDVANHFAQVRQRVTWTNRHNIPATELVFNVHAHYQVPDDQVGFLAKMAEILRMTPSESMALGAPPFELENVKLVPAKPPAAQVAKPAAAHAELKYHWKDDNCTALVVELSHPVGPGESVTIELNFGFRLPQKQGRWGQWKDVTFLSNWLPVLAYFDEKGWQPVPFVPWHQPWFNEAGVYTAHVVLPCDHKVGCTGTIVKTVDRGDGWQELDIMAPAARDFAFIASPRFMEFVDDSGPVKITVLAFPEHSKYARFMLKTAAEAIPVYGAWFGPYPYPEFRIVESYFGWNGNECSGLVMIDERVFTMPQLADGYVEYLVSHEICHQWWYNTVGTNGFCETFMDEGPATYFSHRLLNRKCGTNNNLLKYPKGLGWLPNIYRENYKNYGLYGAQGRGELSPCVQPLEEFGHVANLFAMTYDKGSKVMGMLEERLGEAAFIDFIRIIYAKYFFRVLRVADFQRELEEYTGQSWEEFFQNWVHGKGMSDWCVEKVEVSPKCQCVVRKYLSKKQEEGVTVTVLLHQKAEYTERTVLGFCLKDDGVSYCARVPVIPGVERMEIENPPAVIESVPGNRVRVTLRLPSEPKQIAVDPDHVLLDRDPSNNYWKCWYHWRLTPLYTFLEETDLTNDYDKWNFIAGPWLYFPPSYNDPWFSRSTMFGARAAAYRTQQFTGGVFAAYRYNFQDIIVGADGYWDHWPLPRTQVGFTLERRLDAFFGASEEHAMRAVLYGRYVFDYTSSLYMPPMHYVEVFGTAQDNFLPEPKQSAPGAERFDMLSLGGLHYQLNYLTPYWDPEGGFTLDVTYAAGCAKLNDQEAAHQLIGQFSMVKCLPEWTGPLSATRVAGRVYGAVGLPSKAEYFPLGGDERFRGYSIADRQGSAVWLGSVEWRVPLARGLNWDCCDHIMGVRNLWMAAFYDVGNAYIRGQAVGDMGHAVGAGVRADVAWFSFIDRSILRLDFAKALNDSTPIQVWLGIQHPF
ncbi:MAG: hypothetical protein JNM56_21025 [Planctomycetia bacterium]|nr:hypothetical protein [Planctomycetia bacterium]